MNGTKSAAEAADFLHKEEVVEERSILVEAQGKPNVDGMEVIMRT
jgi:hypothetical protein